MKPPLKQPSYQLPHILPKNESVLLHLLLFSPDFIPLLLIVQVEPHSPLLPLQTHLVYICKEYDHHPSTSYAHTFGGRAHLLRSILFPLKTYDISSLTMIHRDFIPVKKAGVTGITFFNDFGLDSTSAWHFIPSFSTHLWQQEKKGAFFD